MQAWKNYACIHNILMKIFQGNSTIHTFIDNLSLCSCRLRLRHKHCRKSLANIAVDHASLFYSVGEEIMNIACCCMEFVIPIHDRWCQWIYRGLLAVTSCMNGKILSVFLALTLPNIGGFPKLFHFHQQNSQSIYILVSHACIYRTI